MILNLLANLDFLPLIYFLFSGKCTAVHSRFRSLVSITLVGTCCFYARYLLCNYVSPLFLNELFTTVMRRKASHNSRGERLKVLLTVCEVDYFYLYLCLEQGIRDLFICAHESKRTVFFHYFAVFTCSKNLDFIFRTAIMLRPSLLRRLPSSHYCTRTSVTIGRSLWRSTSYW